MVDAFHKWDANMYQATGGLNRSTLPYVTLLGNRFQTSVPIFASFGEREILSPAITAWAEETKALRGNQLELYCDEGVYASIFVGDAMGWGKNARVMSTKVEDLTQATHSTPAQ